MSKSTKKGGVLGRLLGSGNSAKSDSDCCSVQIVEEPEEVKEQTGPAANKNDTGCCASEATSTTLPDEARR